ncbi:hydroxymethylbilane synthase [Candidatus Tokpelaia sp.]|uniref:hydroxymethylbilane synthase n=1 Tax=Candidatus Tokpelaia sp. TaxID=2233777 RepID=UPI00123C4825|nr:hydroxymethylbilane synthase [Candidatus Tokpelaia sp.]KAA6406059.1 hydroxymethylbilane synthase [Candidatus Tokpelaia sp.]
MQRASLKIGTRGSALALAQAQSVRTALLHSHGLPPQNVEIIPISTQGDRLADRPLDLIGGKGLFTQEIEAALAAGRIDIAVHSAKDMPAVLPQGLHLSVFLPREDPRDAFIGRWVTKLADLPAAAKIGTSSIRRRAQLGRLRPDLQIVLLRGNVQTRLEKLIKEGIDGIFLAYAGLKRLGLSAKATEILPLDRFVPAPGQGVIAVESRKNDKRVDALLAPLNDRKTCIETACERSFMAALDGSCRTPLGAYAQLNGEKLHIHGIILAPNGAIFHEIRTSGALEEAIFLGEQAAAELKARAGAGFFADWKKAE